ncbi:ABC transporter permease [Candidatus Puniceispirillum sp.]|nr:ABC transporter permease [Candidatus Puniceispirillum sp.]
MSNAANTRISEPQGIDMVFYRIKKNFTSVDPYLTVFGIFLWLFAYWVLCEGLQIWRFSKLPGPVAISKDWFAFEPFQGISIFTQEYYEHIRVSCQRILIAFGLATGLGVPLGLFMGWSRKVRDYVFPIIETLRPIPILAWVPLSILLLPGFEGPVIFLATLASFFVTALNAMLGVDSIDEEYFRAAGCLGSSKWDVFKNVVVPGALPFIFTGLQISIGVAWFSLVAAEMVSGDLGLGYLIVDAYMNNVTVPMVIAMITLGFIGYFSSGCVRALGNKLMAWHVKELAQQGR